MAIYFMTTKDLMEKYAEQDIDEVIRTDYLIFSSKIQCTIPRRNVINIYNHFLALNVLKGVPVAMDPKCEEAKDAFKRELLKHPKSVSILISILKSGLKGENNIVFLVTPKELKSGNIETFCKAVIDLFHYEILRYPEIGRIDPEECLKRLIYYEKEVEWMELRRLPGELRKEALMKKDKKRLKEMLKEKDAFESGLSKEELVEHVMEVLRG